MTNLNRELREKRQAYKPSLSIILIYAVLGPPVGGLLFLLGILFISLGDGLRHAALTDLSVVGMLKGIRSFLLFYIFTIPFSYMYGFVQALLTGAVLSELLKRRGEAGYAAAFLAPLVIGLGAYLVFDFGLEHDRALAAVIVAAGVLASLVLRLLFRNAFEDK